MIVCCVALSSVRDGINTYTFDEMALTCTMPSSLDIHPGRVVMGCKFEPMKFVLKSPANGGLNLQ